MALVSDIQLQSGAVKPPNLDTSKKFSAEGLTATTAFALTDGGAGTTVSTTGQFTAKSANDLTAWFQSTKANGDTEIYISNDARPDWSLKVSGTASDSFLISNSCSADGSIQGTALSIAPAGAVGLGKFGATDALEINALNSATAALVIANVTDAVSTRMKTESTSGSIGTITNHKMGFMTNATTRGVFDTSGRFGVGTCAPGALLDVRGSAIFNEAGADADFRIEGDDEANLFIVDASTDRIGIGTATPAVELDIDFGGDGTGILMCVNGCICAAGYIGEKAGHTIQCSGSDLATRANLNFVVTGAGTVVDDATNDANVVCISGANTCVPFLLCDGSSDPIALTGGSIGDGLENDPNPKLAGLLCGDGNSMCGICCVTVTGCYFGDGSQLTGVSSVPGCYSGDCTIIGCSAGGNVAGGGSNITLYGANAGYNATTAANIVVIGSTAALCMTTATDQVLIGTQVARCVLTCAGNVAVGAWAFYNECAGTYNTVVGNCAGHTQKGATTNTFVGALAGALDSTGSGNVFIGYKAGCANTTGSCCLVIGNGTCDLITGDFNTASIGLNASIYSTLTVGVDDTGYDVKLFGASAGAFLLYDESADTLDVRGATAAGPGVLKLTTGELTNVDGGILGRLEFQAPLDSAGTDAILVAASIWGEADGTFAAACNKTDLVFATADSETAAEKMRLTSGGNVSIGTATSNNASFGSGVRVLSIEGDTTADYGAVEMISTCAGTAGRLGDLRFINMNGTGSLVAQAGIRAISDGAVDSTAMSFFTEVTGGSFTEKMRITSAGNVGIGTATVGALLHLNKSSGDPDIQFSIGGTDKYIFGADDSDGDYLKISVGGTLGANVGEYGFYGGWGFSIVAPEANDAYFYMVADNGDDVSDAWRMNTNTGVGFSVQHRTSGTSALPALGDTFTNRMVIDTSGNFAFGVNATGADATFYGTTTAKKLFWDASAHSGNGELLVTDGTRITLGTGSDAQMYYDGDDLTINPKAAGSGSLLIGGDVYDDAGAVVIGSMAKQNVMGCATLQVLGTAACDSSMAIGNWQAAATGPTLNFGKSRNATIGSRTVVQDNDILGTIQWTADDGVDMTNQFARLGVRVDDSAGPGNNAVATEMFFGTSDTAGNYAEKMVIGPTGKVGIGTTVPDGELHIWTASAGSVAANTNADELVLENSDDGGLSILTPDANKSKIFFGSPTSNTGGMIVYNNSGVADPDGAGSGTGPDSMHFYTDDAHVISITCYQTVGIGTTGMSFTSSPGDLPSHSLVTEGMVLPMCQISFLIPNKDKIYDVTGNGTNHTFCFNAGASGSCYMQGFSGLTNDKCFTAPISGIYSFDITLKMGGLTSDADYFYGGIYLPNRWPSGSVEYGGAWQQSTQDSGDGGGIWTFTSHTLAQMNVGDYVYVYLAILGQAGDYVDAEPSATGTATKFSGQLLSGKGYG